MKAQVHPWPPPAKDWVVGAALMPASASLSETTTTAPHSLEGDRSQRVPVQDVDGIRSSREERTTPQYPLIAQPAQRGAQHDAAGDAAGLADADSTSAALQTSAEAHEPAAGLHGGEGSGGDKGMSGSGAPCGPGSTAAVNHQRGLKKVEREHSEEYITVSMVQTQPKVEQAYMRCRKGCTKHQNTIMCCLTLVTLASVALLFVFFLHDWKVKRHFGGPSPPPPPAA